MAGSPQQFDSHALCRVALLILLLHVNPIALPDGADAALLGSSEAASSNWPSLTRLSPRERAHSSVSGDEFGYFPSIGTAPLIAPVSDMPIASIAARQSTPVRFNKVFHPGLRMTVLGDLYLADDRPLVAAEAAQLLASTAALLDQAPETDLTLEAYCDERGTEAYSFVTGQQWASIVHRRLQEMRVNKQRMTSVSYGIQQPSCRDNSAACWEDNLRMKWSIRLLSPVTSQRGCLIRLKIIRQRSHFDNAALHIDRSYLRRIQQGERSSSRLLPLSSTR